MNFMYKIRLNAVWSAVLLNLFLFAAFNANEAHAACPPMGEACTQALAERESSGNYQSVNQYGFLGMFQFGEQAMEQVGLYQGDGTNEACLASQGGCDWVGGWTPLAQSYGINSAQDYLNSPEAQHYAVAALAEYNTTATDSTLSQYIGQTINGITITCEGAAMAMHLKGQGAALDFLTSGGAIDKTDANGTPVSEYFGIGAECANGVVAPQPAPTQYESCSADILSVGAQLSESRMQVEKQQIDEAISKPQNVGEMSCVEQFGEMFNREIGAIFGNTDGDDISGVGLEIFNFDGIFTQTQAAINQQINNAINNGLLGGRGLNIGGAITDTMNSMLGGISGGSGNVNFTCEAMNLLWEIMQCQDIFDFKIPSLKDLMGDFSLSGLLSDIMPDSCAGQVLTEAALERAGTVFSSFDQTLADAISPSSIENTANQY